MRVANWEHRETPDAAADAALAAALPRTASRIPIPLPYAQLPAAWHHTSENRQQREILSSSRDRVRVQIARPPKYAHKPAAGLEAPVHSFRSKAHSFCFHCRFPAVAVAGKSLLTSRLLIDYLRLVAAHRCKAGAYEEVVTQAIQINGGASVAFAT